MGGFGLTLPETNSEFTPENGWLEYQFPFGMAFFQGRTVSFRECIEASSLLNTEKGSCTVPFCKVHVIRKYKANYLDKRGLVLAEMLLISANHLGCCFAL